MAKFEQTKECVNARDLWLLANARIYGVNGVMLDHAMQF